MNRVLRVLAVLVFLFVAADRQAVAQGGCGEYQCTFYTGNGFFCGHEGDVACAGSFNGASCYQCNCQIDDPAWCWYEPFTG